jgi:hydroxymethylbilane synthase
MDLPEGFALAAVMEREDPRDAWVSPRHASLAELPQGARVGTSSLRRVVQLRARRPDLVIEPVRGNLDTRLRKLDEGQFDAIVLAAAGLKRLGMASRIRSVFEVDEMIPCAGQGALGLEVRSDDHELAGLLQGLVHAPTMRATEAERAVSRSLGGSCSMPLAAHGRWVGRELELTAALGHADDATAPLLKVQVRGVADEPAQAEALGRAAAAALVERGGQAYLEAAARLDATASPNRAPSAG